KRAYCLKIQPATGSFARNLIYSTKPIHPQATHLYCAPTLLAVRCDTPEHVMVSYDELKVVGSAS
ncbi:hypothetical protein L2I55_24715, partial [Klebsiella pneumoniae]|uniref:hypothetical protein n=1 Tax=Klebsiella pneumoniae TaxID=573 RepID=UPI001F3693C6